MSSGRKVWRITSVRYADQAFDGEGARRYGGRWNRPGIAVAYCSMTLSLAALEFFVHLEPSLAPKGLVCVAAEIPGNVSTEEIDLKDLPADWRSYPAPERLLDLEGDALLGLPVLDQLKVRSAELWAAAGAGAGAAVSPTARSSSPGAPAGRTPDRACGGCSTRGSPRRTRPQTP